MKLGIGIDQDFVLIFSGLKPLPLIENYWENLRI